MQSLSLTKAARLAGSAVESDLAWPTLLLAHAALVPAYPGPLVVPMLVVPAPPRLTAAMGAGERLRRVGAAYTGACERARPGRCWAADTRTADTTRMGAHGPRFAHLATWLLSAGIPPAAWCAFSVDVWLHHYARFQPMRSALRMRPSVNWVCGDEHIKAHEVWYWAESTRYQGGHARCVDEHRELLVKWSRMRSELLVEARKHTVAIPHDVVFRIVRQHFARGEYESTVHRAKLCVQRKQSEYNDRVANGEFLL